MATSQMKEDCDNQKESYDGMEDVATSQTVIEDCNNQKESYDDQRRSQTTRQLLLVEQQHKEIQVLCSQVNCPN